jgi:hypothetical protein
VYVYRAHELIQHRRDTRARAHLRLLGRSSVLKIPHQLRNAALAVGGVRDKGLFFEGIKIEI